jgi:Fe2+/Zn2+ uptake regulation proteins
VKRPVQYATKSKKRIIEHIESMDEEHFNAYDIISHFIKENPPISSATIYRQLDRMVSEGKLRRYVLSDKEGACYHYLGDNDSKHCCNKYHLKCITCGKLVHLQCHTIENLMEHIVDAHHFFIEPESTVFYGRCEECMAIRG